ncbi:MAG: Plug domain-containing protein [Bacteroidetes bacterium]|nr:Plug domain-containing protein [Bacteroidota bacterium]
MNELGTVTISAEKSNRNVTKTEMGVIDVPIQKIELLPAILGEPDVLKSDTITSWCIGGSRRNNRLFVRGGNADQNLVQLDEAVVYNPNHLFGLFSTFNERALNKVTLIKGGFPAQYGDGFLPFLILQ